MRPYHITDPIVDRYTDTSRQLRPPHGPGLIVAMALTDNPELIGTDGHFTRVPSLAVLLVDRTTFLPVPR